MRVFYENTQGEKHELTSGALRIVSINGADPYTSITTIDNAYSAGSTYIKERIGQRSITMQIAVSGAGPDEARDFIRRLFRFGEEGTLSFIYEYDYKITERTIKCRVEKIPYTIKERPDTMQVSLLCTDPFFKGESSEHLIAGIIPMWEFPFELPPEGEYFEFSSVQPTGAADIINNGDVEAGCVISVLINSSTDNIQITNRTTGKYFRLNYGFSEGDRVVIDSRLNCKSAVLNGQEDILYCMDTSSSFIVIVPGVNRISYDGELMKASVEAVFEENYMGI